MRCWLVIKRNELGLTQEEVAKKAAIARTTYAMIEQDNRTPSVNVAKRLSKVLGVDWTLFFEEKCHESCKISEIKHA
ncbi:helix-turn-helix transcriptional regulator [Brevibacillus thermoruber]|uniref:helix-turn-helix transcriptional regulator n=1 Tax=Brevibacillus thermoruber TaxID=33942 RepID=UPI0009DD6F33|nr:helix-turn-helix transcriptional regulator [Brevibacillus thermoruber]